MCPDCAARNSELRKQNRKYHERIGICTHCGKNPAEPNKKLCYECLGQFQDSYSEKGKTDEQKEKDRLRKRQLKQTRIENGLCPRCGKHQSQNGGLCQRCRAYLKNYRDKNRCDLSRSERPDYGIDDFHSWCSFLESKGYKCYTQILNAKDYGVAQNRERCFMVSILGDYNYKFPQPIPLDKTMKDYLEDEVDEKYYINSEKAQKLIKDLRESGQLDGISKTVRGGAEAQ